MPSACNREPQLTVESSNAKSGPYAGAGLAGPFPVTFRFLDNSHLLVIRSAGVVETTLTLNVDYTVIGAGFPAGGSITLTVGLPVGQNLTLLRKVPITQLTAYQQSDSFPAKSHEEALDKLTMIAQGTAQDISGAIRVPENLSTLPLLPAASARIGNVLVFDAQGNPALAAALPAGQFQFGVNYRDRFVAGNYASFTLSANPGLLNNIRMFAGGVEQFSIDDWTWTAGDPFKVYPVTTFPTDVKFEIRYTQALPVGSSTADQVSFSQNSVFAIGSVGRKLQQIISPRDAPWNAVGDGIADDTAAMVAFFLFSAGYDCNLEGRTYLVASSLAMQAGATYRNGKIKAKNSAGLSSVLTASTITRLIIDNIEIDGNADNGGSILYGIFLQNGVSNIVRNSYVHDTKNAGIRVDTEDAAMVLNSRFINCGRTGVTDNHGIMIGSSTGICQNWLIQGCYVRNAFRKGITTYGFAPGSCVNGRLNNNRVSDCALGGFYITGDLGTVVGAKNITLSNNIAFNNYVNYEIANCSGITATGNDSHYTTTTGFYAGWAVEGAQGVSIQGGINDSAPFHGVVLSMANSVPCLNVSVRGMVITNPNQTSAATGCGVQITDSTFCTIDVDVSDTTAKMTHGILEGAGGDNNDLGSSIRNGTAARVSITGANTRTRNRSGQNTGHSVQDPLNTLHIDGGVTMVPQVLVLATGANHNVVLPARAGFLYIIGPSGAFSITGFAGGHDGRQIRLYNYSNQICTVKHNDVGSAVGNKFANKLNADYTLGTQQGATFDFLTTTNAWLSTQG